MYCVGVLSSGVLECSKISPPPFEDTLDFLTHALLWEFTMVVEK